MEKYTINVYGVDENSVSTLTTSNSNLRDLIVSGINVFHYDPDYLYGIFVPVTLNQKVRIASDENTAYDNSTLLGFHGLTFEKLHFYNTESVVISYDPVLFRTNDVLMFPLLRKNLTGKILHDRIKTFYEVILRKNMCGPNIEILQSVLSKIKEVCAEAKYDFSNPGEIPELSYMTPYYKVEFNLHRE